MSAGAAERAAPQASWGPVVRVRSLPKPDADAHVPPWVALLPAAIAARHARRHLLYATIRPRPRADVHLLVAGEDAVARTGPLHLTFPAGAHADPVNERGVQELFSALRWMRCPGRPDPLVRAAEEQRGFPPRDGLAFESSLESLGSVPFGWLVVAEPVKGLDQELADIELGLPTLRNRAETSEEERLELRRAEARLAELLQFRDGGSWRIHVLAGGASDAAARRVAGLLVGALDLGTLPYRVMPGTATGAFGGVWRREVADADGLRSPMSGSAGLLAALAPVPRRELPGYRVVAAPSFHLTAESTEGLLVGAILDRRREPVGELRVSRRTLNRHALVCGATGSGKSQTVRHLLAEATIAGLPWMVLEPAKAEYAAMAGRLGAGKEVVVIRPGARDAAAVSMNPLEPEPRFPIQAHLDMVRALFDASFGADQPFPQVLAWALRRAYEQAGWNLVTDRPAAGRAHARWPTLRDLQGAAMDVVKDIGYGAEITRDVTGFIDIRLGSLRLGASGRFLEGGHPLDIARLMECNVVFELEDIVNEQDKAFVLGTLVIRLVEHLRTRDRGSDGLCHLTVIEEAHRLMRRLPPESPSAYAVELFAGMLAEIRAYGEGLVVAEQIPEKLVSDVVRNTALKVMHRLPSAEDRQAVGATMNLDEAQSRFVVALVPGEAAVFADGMDEPMLVRVPLAEEAALPPQARPPVPVRGPRSRACGLSCSERPCTAHELADAAENLASGDMGARVTVWVELAALAHLCHERLPGVPRGLVGELGALPRRRRECLIGQAADASVAPRADALGAVYDPAAFSLRLARAATEAFAGPRAVVRPAVRWLWPGWAWLEAFTGLEGLDPEAAAPPVRIPVGSDAPPDGEVRTRARWLLQHPAGLQRPANRELTRRALLGVDDLAVLDRATERLEYAASREQRLARAVRRLCREPEWALQVVTLATTWLDRPERFARPGCPRSG